MAKEIDEAPNDYKYFKALKKIRTKKKSTNNYIHDEKGNIILNIKEKYKLVKNHFRKHFFDSSICKIRPFSNNI